MRAALFSPLVVLCALAGCSAGTAECTCQPCVVGAAVTLSVIDARTGAPVTTFLVDATVNGVPMGQPASCEEDAREGNACVFGDEGGLYHLVVGAPGYETREVLVRQADQGVGDLCCDGRVCLTSEEITVALDPLAPP